MKHTIRGNLYKIAGDERHIYSYEAIQHLPIVSILKVKKGEAYEMTTKTAEEKPFRIYDEIGSAEYRLGYLYGEKSYFDTAEERADYRLLVAEEAKIEAIARAKRKIEEAKKEIEKNLKILEKLEKTS